MTTGHAHATSDGPIVRVDREADGTTVILAGELDYWAVREVGRALDGECDRKPGRLTLDLGAVDFVDSTALHLFVRVDRRLKDDGCVLELRGASAHVQRVLELTGLDTLIAVSPSSNSDGSGGEATP